MAHCRSSGVLHSRSAHRRITDVPARMSVHRRITDPVQRHAEGRFMTLNGPSCGWEPIRTHSINPALRKPSRTWSTHEYRP